MPDLHVLRVFTAADGSGGNPLGVFLEGERMAPGDRQAAAAALGFSETVFVDDPGSGSVQIFTPTVEMPFAGHPLVGTAWLLAAGGEPPAVLRPPAGEVPARTQAGRRSWQAGPSGRRRSSGASWRRRLTWRRSPPRRRATT